MVSPVKIWRNQRKIRKILGIRGEVISFTRVHIPPAGFEKAAPYNIVLVKLENGERYTAQLVDRNEQKLRIGQKVIAILRKTRYIDNEEVIPYGIKFKAI